MDIDQAGGFQASFLGVRGEDEFWSAAHSKALIEPEGDQYEKGIGNTLKLRPPTYDGFRKEVDSFKGTLLNDDQLISVEQAKLRISMHTNPEVIQQSMLELKAWAEANPKPLIDRFFEMFVSEKEVRPSNLEQYEKLEQFFLDRLNHESIKHFNTIIKKILNRKSPIRKKLSQLESILGTHLSIFLNQVNEDGVSNIISLMNASRNQEELNFLIGTLFKGESGFIDFLRHNVSQLQHLQFAHHLLSLEDISSSEVSFVKALLHEEGLRPVFFQSILNCSRSELLVLLRRRSGTQDVISLLASELPERHFNVLLQALRPVDVRQLIREHDELKPILQKQLVLAKKREVANRPVVVTDMVADTLHVGIGDVAEFLKAESGIRISRIIQNIEILAEAANHVHTEANFKADSSGNLDFKKDRENHVTRLLTNEFSFYPNTPLRQDEFLTIVEHVSKMAASLNPNLILVLASFPVLGADGQVHNTVLQAACGKEPQVSLFAKTLVSVIDAEYDDIPLSRDYQYIHEKHIEDAVPMTLLSDKDRHGFTIERNAVKEITTAGGAKFYSIVDICLDHAHNIGKNTWQHEVERAQTSDSLEGVPMQLTHMLTSHGMGARNSAAVGTKVTHADVRAEYWDFRTGFERPTRQAMPPSLESYLDQSAAYGNLKWQVDESTITLSDLPFGKPIRLSINEPHRLDTMPRTIFVDISMKALTDG